jgi:hypothetical protein
VDREAQTMGRLIIRIEGWPLSRLFAVNRENREQPCRFQQRESAI